MLKPCCFIVSLKQLKTITKLQECVKLGNHKYHTGIQPYLKTSIFRAEDRNRVLDKRFPPVRLLHSTSVKNASKKDEDEIAGDKALLLFSDFEKTKQKNKKSFFELVRVYESNFGKTRGHVDFMRAALRQMEAFGVHKDLEAYKKILNVLPKGVYVSKTYLMAEMMYHPRQQYVALDLLIQMEANKVRPDVEVGEMLEKIFGHKSHPYQRYARMMYWTTKMKNRSPWAAPKKLPSSPYLFAKMVVERITSVDLQTEIVVFNTENVPESIDHTWIVSGQSPKQRELLQKHSPDTPVIVEGGEVAWLKTSYVNYFVLKADLDEPRPYIHPPPADNLYQMESLYMNPSCTVEEEEASVHEQDDGIIYGVCVTGTSSKDSLLSWVRLLQENGNPTLGKVPVLFRFKNADKSPTPFTEELVKQKTA